MNDPATNEPITEADLRSDDAERALIGSLALGATHLADVLARLPGSDFYSPHRGYVWDACRALSGEREPIEPTRIGRRLADAGRWNPATQAVVAQEFLAGRDPTYAAQHADMVADLARRRELFRAIRRAELIVRDHSGDVSEALGKVRAQFDGITTTLAGQGGPMDWDAVVDEFRTIHDTSDVEPAKPPIVTPWPDFDAVIGGLFPGRMYVIGGRPGVGKALALDTPIPTPAGWTTMGAIRVGDVVLGADGRPTTVTNAWEVRHGRPCFEVEFSDGSVIVADAEHQWLTDTRASRKSAAELRRRAATRGWSPFSRDQRDRAVTASVVTTEQIAATLRVNADQRLNHSIPTCAPLHLPVADLLVPPYTLGVWLGDGRSAGASYTSADPEIAAYVEAEGLHVVRLTTPMQYAIKLSDRAPHGPRVCTSCGRPATGAGQCLSCWSQRGNVTARLRTIGVLNNKHIPNEYLRASEPQRRALLAGLLDTDGTVGARGQVQFCVTNERLARHFVELAAGLGYRPVLTSRPVLGRSAASSTAYTVNFSTADDVFRLERKRLLHKERRAAVSESRTRQRYVVNVRPVGSVPVRCIEVDNADHLYLAGRSMIPTHNSAAALCIAADAAIVQRRPTLVISREMPTVDIMGRIFARATETPLHAINTRRMTPQMLREIDAYVAKVGRPPLTVDAKTRTLAGIKAVAREQAHQFGLDLLVVDYLQLVRVTGRSNREQEVAEVSRELKALAMDLDCAVVVPAQLNRGPLHRAEPRPVMSDLRESGQIEQDADVVVLLHRPRDETGVLRSVGEIEFILDKHRHGATTNLTLQWYGPVGAIA